jgi:hypothetical protein
VIAAFEERYDSSSGAKASFPGYRVLADEHRVRRLAVLGTLVGYENLSADRCFENGADAEGHFERRLAERNEINTSLLRRPLSQSFTDESGEVHVRGPPRSDASRVFDERHDEAKRRAAMSVTIGTS